MTRRSARHDDGGRWRFIIAALAVVLLWPSLAFAHASLVTSEPAADAVLATSPKTMSLTFNEAVEPLALHLIDGSGRSSDVANLVSEGATLRFAPPASLPNGAHVLSWRVISADGHPVGGSLTFWIGAPGERLPAIEVQDNPARRSAIWATGILVNLAALSAVGAAFFLAWVAIGPAGAATRAGVAGTAIVGLGALALSIGLQGLDVLDLPFPSLGDRQVWSAGTSGSFGLSVGIAAAALGLSLSAVVGRTGVSRLTALMAVLGLGASFAVSGHTATAEPRALAAGAMLVHGASLALWVGALVPLAVSVAAGPARAVALRRFSRAIPFAIAALLISGVVLSAVELRRVDALWTSFYGRILLAKLTLVVVLLLLALWNRTRLTPLLLAGADGAVGTMRRSIVSELILVAAILGIVGLWRFNPPPAQQAGAPVQQGDDNFFTHLHTERVMANVTIKPGRAGPVDIDIGLQTPDEAPLAAQALTVSLANPDAGIEAASAQAQRQGDGSWRVRMVAPVPGRWMLTLGVLISDFDKVTVTAPVVIR
ncbi:copper resistance protein CopC [Rhodopseudomonas sp. B29]|uniref:copper resistance CopC/CopD family protein n=1 Tax=Rhodopseudomonas sp. B29 TaxID=95607 RepID=UPI0003469638|nr:copper resistance protein CopC [Rhodopseudomonas sp. B29]